MGRETERFKKERDTRGDREIHHFSPWGGGVIDKTKCSIKIRRTKNRIDIENAKALIKKKKKRTRSRHGRRMDWTYQKEESHYFFFIF